MAIGIAEQKALQFDGGHLSRQALRGGPRRGKGCTKYGHYSMITDNLRAQPTAILELRTQRRLYGSGSYTDEKAETMTVPGASDTSIRGPAGLLARARKLVAGKAGLIVTTLATVAVIGLGLLIGWFMVALGACLLIQRRRGMHSRRRYRHQARTT